jgi:hypothetical protein
MEAVLSTLYRLAQPDAWGPVATACGGCLSHWVERSSNEGRLLPFVDRLRIFGPRIDPTAALGSLPLALPNLAFVAVDDLQSTLDGPASRIGAALIGRLRPHTILLPCTAPETVHRLVQQQLQELESEAFIDTYERSRPDALAGGEGEVRLVYWLDPDIDETSISGLRAAPCAMTVVIAPRSLPDPVRPDRLLLDVVPHTDVEAAFRVLAA